MDLVAFGKCHHVLGKKNKAQQEHHHINEMMSYDW